MSPIEGTAVIYCEGALTTTNGKTAHGLLRRSHRYRIASVVDSTVSGRTTGSLIRGCRYDVPVLGSVEVAVQEAARYNTPATHLVIGLAPDGGRLPEASREHILKAISLGLNVVSGLHDFLSEDREFSGLALTRGVTLTDLRKLPERKDLHFFSGKIRQVEAPRVAVLGTDSAVGKRTTAWMLTDALNEKSIPATFVGTGQTALLQGAKHGVVFDALINDFVTGEIEHAVYRAWEEERPRVIVVEGQGSLLNPAYPGGLEILAAAAPCCIVLQHAPARKEYDGLPGFLLHPIRQQIQALKLISGRPVVAVTVNSEGLTATDIGKVCTALREETGLCTVDPLIHGVEEVVEVIRHHIQRTEDTANIRRRAIAAMYE